jgi:hypothetical protein
MISQTPSLQCVEGIFHSEFEIEREDHQECFMRLIQRYAEANDRVYAETGKSTHSGSN